MRENLYICTYVAAEDLIKAEPTATVLHSGLGTIWVLGFDRPPPLRVLLVLTGVTLL